nr:MAG TPA: hypothetical protein [Caudoviricetes sp.]
MILNIPDPIVSGYVCATVIFGGWIILFGLLWCLLFIGGKAIFEFSAHCKFWRNLVEAAFERIRTKSKKDAYPKE